MWTRLLLLAVISISDISSQNNSTDCVCVLYYNCDAKKGTVISDGRGFIDERANFPKCKKSTETCCKLENEPTATTRAVAVATSCGVRHPDGVNFKVFTDPNPFNLAEFGEFPWMVAILRNNGSYRCGGSLIQPSVVLTAAHCVLDEDKYVARAGEWDSAQTEEILKHQDIKVASVKIHEEFMPGIYYNDVALLFLEAPFKLKPHINTICLPPTNLTARGRCFAHGWGRQRFDTKMYPTILKNIELPLIPKDECQNTLRKTRLGTYFRLHRSFICAGGEEGKDVCVGDGGGPLVCKMEGEERYQQVGIVSWGLGCGDKGIPGVYADVAYLRGWIDRQLSEHNDLSQGQTTNK